jgi:LytS/YehU family sensor histidine kinase
VLTKTDPELACETLLGFADLMRYQLNECEKEKVQLAMEIRYIENFLKLEKLRKNRLDLKIDYDSQEIGNLYIEPLLFVSLIENAVKHGSQRMENGFIHVSLARSSDSLIFEVCNSKPGSPSGELETSLGKGIANLRRRLDLSYPKKHVLELNEETHQFTATMKLQIE